MKNIKKDLVSLIVEHPTLPIIPAIRDETVYGSRNKFGNGLTKIDKVKVDYYLFDSRSQYWFAGQEKIYNYIKYNYKKDNIHIDSDKVSSNMILEEFNKLKKEGVIKKGIIIYISEFNGD